MREILFRGKRIDNGEWVDGSLLFDPDLGSAQIIGFEYWTSETGIERGEFSELVDTATVGQYTNLHDKNWKRIFEGDIVEYDDGFDYFKGEVVFENGAFGVGSFVLTGISSGCSDNFANLWQLFWDQETTDEPELYYCTVIGNIHDNTELMG